MHRVATVPLPVAGRALDSGRDVPVAMPADAIVVGVAPNVARPAADSIYHESLRAVIRKLSAFSRIEPEPACATPHDHIRV
jgi:hypothetical protein